MTAPEPSPAVPDPAPAASNASAATPVATAAATPGPAQAVIAPAKIRWMRLLLIAAPIAGAILAGRHLYLNADSTKEAARVEQARQRLATYPEQPDRAYGYWRRLLEDPNSSPGLQATARTEIQALIDGQKLTERLEAMIADLLRRGENDMAQSLAYAETLLYLSREFKTGETPAAAQTRIDRIRRIGDGYRDAINDRVVRGQYDKALEKLIALYAEHPEAEYIRPVIARIQSEVAEAMISLDDLEGARVRFQEAIKADPLAVYRQRLEALDRSIASLDPTAFIAAGRQAEQEGRWEEAQAQYQKALDYRRSNKEAAAGYTRILKFYAEIFLKNAEEDEELSEQGAKFVKLAADNANKMAQFGDPELVLARADLMLAEIYFREEDTRKAKETVDAALASIARPYRATTDGAYLMARIFKLYYHLGRNMNRLPQARQSLALADEYCRLALEKGHAKAGDLFVQIHNLTRIELEIAGSLGSGNSLRDTDTPPTQDALNLVNEGPLGAVGPLDVAGETDNPERRRPAAGPAADPASTPTPTPADKALDPATDKLLNPLK